MKRFALLVLIAATAAGPVAAQVKVSGAWVRLGDVAPVAGEAGQLIVSPAPPPGESLSLDPAFLVATARKAGVIVTLPLDQPILVSRTGALPATAAPQAPIAPKAPVAGAPQTLASDQILVLVRDIPRGSIIGYEDLDWVDPAKIHAPRMALSQSDDVVGKETRRPLRAGVHVLASDLKAPTVIRKGEAVAIVYESAGVRLTTDGQALNDAGAGEPVRVLNKYTKRSIDAVASAAGEARIER